MRSIILIARFLVGLLFIVSGLVKANDPLGLSYKIGCMVIRCRCL
jgi:uncharacterized membrane protein YphA (DoxX/SURF4 family)